MTVKFSIRQNFLFRHFCQRPHHHPILQHEYVFYCNAHTIIHYKSVIKTLRLFKIIDIKITYRKASYNSSWFLTNSSWFERNMRDSNTFDDFEGSFELFLRRCLICIVKFLKYWNSKKKTKEKDIYSCIWINSIIKGLCIWFGGFDGFGASFDCVGVARSFLQYNDSFSKY